MKNKMADMNIFMAQYVCHEKNGGKTTGMNKKKNQLLSKDDGKLGFKKSLYIKLCTGSRKVRQVGQYKIAYVVKTTHSVLQKL